MSENQSDAVNMENLVYFGIFIAKTAKLKYNQEKEIE